MRIRFFGQGVEVSLRDLGSNPAESQQTYHHSKLKLDVLVGEEPLNLFYVQALDELPSHQGP